MAVADEPVEVVDGEGRVLDVVPRSVMRQGSLTHRSTYVAVIGQELEPLPPAGLVAALDTAAGKHSEAERLDMLRRCGLGGHSRLVVHQRAGWKDVNPSYWDIAFGGVCGVGETWLESARRELAEEAGLTTHLIDLGSGRYTDDHTDIVARCFLAATEDEPTCPDGEVIELDVIRLSRLDEWLSGRAVCPDSVALLGPILRSIGRL
jgi:8-oxo-dGTP pyrophosphatase MutT (NUDIX family)